MGTTEEAPRRLGVPSLTLEEDQIVFMGCVCGSPLPPLDPRLVGKWGSNDSVMEWHVGYGVYRVSRRHVPFMKTAPKQAMCRIEVKASGWISYVLVEKSKWVTL